MCTKKMASHGILGIAGKVFSRQTKLLHLIEVNLYDLIRGKIVQYQSFFKKKCVWTAHVSPLSIHSTMGTILISEQSLYDLTYLITAPNKLYYSF
jgi:hypothetical protein